MMSRALICFTCFCSALKAAIPLNVDAIQKTVVFLYAEKSGQLDASQPVGTGFFVSAQLKGSQPPQKYTVLVTARHIVDPQWAKCQGGNPTTLYARLNKKKYAPETDSTGIGFVKIPLQIGNRLMWSHHPDNHIDAAVIMFNAPIFDEYDVESIGVSEFPTEAEWTGVSVGDRLTSTGLMPAFPGNRRNYPVFKFGEVSSIPKEDVETSCAPGMLPQFPVRIWFVSMNQVPGSSGAPIFYFPLLVPGKGITVSGMITRAMLVGVQSISFLGADIAGMTPIKYVYEILVALNFPNADMQRGPSVVP
jgi:hypothetical protein